MDSSFSRALSHNTDKVVEGKDSSLQEQLTKEVNLQLKNQNSQQQSLEGLSSILFHNIRPIIKHFIAQRDLPVSGRLKNVRINWEKLTCNPFILNLVQGYQIPFSSKPVWNYVPRMVQMNQEEVLLVDQDIQKVLRKGAIQNVQASLDQFLSSVFAAPKKDKGHRPVINLKKLKKDVSNDHFKKEVLFLLKEDLQKGHHMCKTGLNDTYFSVPLHPKSQKFVRVQWKGQLFQFLCLCFGLGPAPKLFTKLLKTPVALLRKLMVRLIKFPNNILIMAASIEELTLARDSLIYLLQGLGFVINIKKFSFAALLKLRVSRGRNKFKGYDFSTSRGKEERTSGAVSIYLKESIGGNQRVESDDRPVSLNNHCSSDSTSTVSNNATSAYNWVFHEEDCDSEMNLSEEVRAELNWFVENIHLNYGKTLLSNPPQLIIASDASLKGWSA